jgi:hypothetical protein
MRIFKNNFVTSLKPRLWRGKLAGFSLRNIAVIVFAIILPSLSFAEGGSIGDVAENLVQGELTIRDVIQDICIITGVAFILGSLIQYRKHRQNPSEVTLSTVFVNLIIGILVLLMAFIPIKFL